MKYRDYLILPAIVMYIIFASCAFIGKMSVDPEMVSETVISEPTASVNPSEMSWGQSDSEYGECWYAEGTRMGDYFTVNTSSSSKDIYFYDSKSSSGKTAAEPTPYVVKDMHMLASTQSGRKYDLIFLDEMTAYDCISGTYFQRADYSSLKQQLTSGKFVNSTNSRDYYVFKNNGKSCEHFGDQLFKGNWVLDTTDTLCVYDYSCQENFHFNLIFDGFGKISGFTFNEIIYTLVD